MSISSLKELESSSPGDRLSSLLSTPEDQWFDRKSGRIAAKDLARTLVAFANAEGGTVIIGLHGGAFDGTMLTVDRENSLRQAGMDFTNPPVRAYLARLDVGRERSVVRIDIPPSEQVHETNTGDVYLRVGDESKKLTYTQRRELEYDRGAAHFEGEPAPGAELEDLDDEQLSQYREAIGASASHETALRARSLLTRDGRPNHAALLLLAAHPQEWLPQAYVRVMRYSRDTPGTGTRQTLESGKDLRFEGPLAEVIVSASACIDSWVPKHRALGPQARFTDVPVIPTDAWMEGLVNAVVHRSYSMAGDHIRISIYPGRIEIESPGRFPGLADPTRPLEIARYARNPRIARVCSDLGITLERGEGIRRIFEEMRMVGLTDPVYEQTSGSVRLILTAIGRLDPRVEESLPPGADEILQLLRTQGGPLGTGEITDATGRSRPWIRTALEALREAGLVEWRGRSAKDPRATWEIVR